MAARPHLAGDDRLPGRLILGSTFNWPDLPEYALGVALGACFEILFRRSRLGVNHAAWSNCLLPENSRRYSDAKHFQTDMSNAIKLVCLILPIPLAGCAGNKNYLMNVKERKVALLGYCHRVW